MSKTKTRKPKVVSPTDPATLPGSISGPGGPHDRGKVVLDASHAVLLDHCTVCTVDDAFDVVENAPVLAMLLEGRINAKDDRASVLFMMNSDGVAAVLTEMLGLLGRMGVEVGGIYEDIARRMDEQQKEGLDVPNG